MAFLKFAYAEGLAGRPADDYVRAHSKIETWSQDLLMAFPAKIPSVSRAAIRVHFKADSAESCGLKTQRKPAGACEQVNDQWPLIRAGFITASE
jgi:hypothetical protein